jgi:DNA polymerase-3 subunit gamma/tau
LDIVEWDAARASSIDSIRDLKQATRISPTFVKYRIYILDEIHMLSPQAFDALLKLLEEPPKHCVFILATTELDQVPETIRSRVQIFKFGLIPPKEVESRLRYISQEEGISLPDSAFAYISKAGKGSMRDSISILSRLQDSSLTWNLEDVLKVLGYPSKEMVDSFISLLLKRDPRVVEILSELGTVDLFLFWDEAISHLKSRIETTFGSESILPLARTLQTLIDKRTDLAISSNPLAVANLMLLTFFIP